MSTGYNKLREAVDADCREGGGPYIRKGACSAVESVSTNTVISLSGLSTEPNPTVWLWGWIGKKFLQLGGR